MPVCKKTFLILFIAILWSAKGSSQEGSLYTNDYLDAFITNPACTGAEYYPVAHVLARKQWLGFTDSPGMFLASGNFRIGSYDFYDPKGFVNTGPVHLKDRIGLGAAVFQDRNGPLSTTGGILSYAYSVPLDIDSRLSFGLSVHMLHYALNTSVLKPDQPNDPYLFEGKEGRFNFNVGIGVYYHTDRYFGGLSVMKILPGVSNVSEMPVEKPSYFLMGGYKLNRQSSAFNYEPSLEIKKMQNEKIILDLRNKVYIKRLNWIAFSYSTSQLIRLQFGLRIYKMAYVGYSSEFSLSRIARYNFGTHEISLGINLGLIGVEGLREAIRSADN